MPARQGWCQEPTTLARFLSLERSDQNRGSVKLSATASHSPGEGEARARAFLAMSAERRYVTQA
jgi:hypothetical protein